MSRLYKKENVITFSQDYIDELILNQNWGELKKILLIENLRKDIKQYITLSLEFSFDNYYTINQ